MAHHKVKKYKRKVMKIYMANHIVKNISLLTLLLIFQIILRRAGTLTKKKSSNNHNL